MRVLGSEKRKGEFFFLDLDLEKKNQNFTHKKSQLTFGHRGGVRLRPTSSSGGSGGLAGGDGRGLGHGVLGVGDRLVGVDLCVFRIALLEERRELAGPRPGVGQSGHEPVKVGLHGLVGPGERGLDLGHDRGVVEGGVDLGVDAGLLGGVVDRGADLVGVAVGALRRGGGRREDRGGGLDGLGGRDRGGGLGGQGGDGVRGRVGTGGQGGTGGGSGGNKGVQSLVDLLRRRRHGAGQLLVVADRLSKDLLGQGRGGPGRGDPGGSTSGELGGGGGASGLDLLLEGGGLLLQGGRGGGGGGLEGRSQRRDGRVDLFLGRGLSFRGAGLDGGHGLVEVDGLSRLGHRQGAVGRGGGRDLGAVGTGGFLEEKEMEEKMREGKR